MNPEDNLKGDQGGPKLFSRSCQGSVHTTCFLGPWHVAPLTLKGEMCTRDAFFTHSILPQKLILEEDLDVPAHRAEASRFDRVVLKSSWTFRLKSK